MCLVVRPQNNNDKLANKLLFFLVKQAVHHFLIIFNLKARHSVKTHTQMKINPLEVCTNFI